MAATNLVITNQGLSAIANADAGGFLLKISSFKVTQATAVPAVTDSSLVGTAVYTGGVVSIEVLNDATVMFTINIPRGIPQNNGIWNLREIGLYLESGVLFAHGAIVPTLVKTSDFDIRLKVFITANQLGGVVNVITTESMSLPAVATVDSLPASATCPNNVVAVLDSQIGDANTAGLAVRFNSGNNWAFTDHTRLATVNPLLVVSQTALVFDPTDYGFWMIDGEQVILQVVGGGGIGQSRRAQYSVSSKRLTVLGSAFIGVTTNSDIAVWRSTANVLPKRGSSIPEYMVLGHGVKNVVSSVSSAQVSTTKLLPNRVTLTGARSSVDLSAYSWAANVLSDPSRLIVSVDGSIIVVTSTDINLTDLTVDVSALSLVDLIAFEQVSGSASIYLHEAVYDASSMYSTANPTGYIYQLPAIPTSNQNLLVFVDDNLLPPTQYGITGSHVTLSTYPTAGKVVLCPIVIYTEGSVFGSVSLDSFVHGTETSLTLSSTTRLKKDTLVFINGIYCVKSSYNVSGNKLSWVVTPISGAKVDVYNFYASSTGSTATPTPISGIDTGSMWIDPAFPEKSNTLIPVLYQYVTTAGYNNVFDIEPVSSEDYITLFIDGRWYSKYEFICDPLFTQLTVPALLKGGKHVDIYCWTSIPSSGSQIACQYSSVPMTIGTSSYNLVTPHTVDVSHVERTMVFVDNAYQHQGLWGCTVNSVNGVNPVIIQGSSTYVPATPVGSTMTMYRINDTGDGVTKTWGLTVGSGAGDIPDTSHILVYVDGELRQANDDNYPYSVNMTANSLTFTTPIPNGIRCSFIYFASVASTGSKTACRSFSLYVPRGTPVNDSYDLGFTVSNSNHCIVHVAGVFAHTGYTISGSTLTIANADTIVGAKYTSADPSFPIPNLAGGSVSLFYFNQVDADWGTPYLHKDIRDSNTGAFQRDSLHDTYRFLLSDKPAVDLTLANISNITYCYNNRAFTIPTYCVPTHGANESALTATTESAQFATFLPNAPDYALLSQGDNVVSVMDKNVGGTYIFFTFVNDSNPEKTSTTVQTEDYTNSVLRVFTYKYSSAVGYVSKVKSVQLSRTGDGYYVPTVQVNNRNNILAFGQQSSNVYMVDTKRLTLDTSNGLTKVLANPNIDSGFLWLNMFYSLPSKTRLVLTDDLQSYINNILAQINALQSEQSLIVAKQIALLNENEPVGCYRHFSIEDTIPAWYSIVGDSFGRSLIGAGGVYNQLDFVSGSQYGSNDAVVVDHNHTVPWSGDNNDGGVTAGGDHRDGDCVTSGALDSSGNPVGESGINKNIPRSIAAYLCIKTRLITLADYG